MPPKAGYAFCKVFPAFVCRVRLEHSVSCFCITGYALCKGFPASLTPSGWNGSIHSASLSFCARDEGAMGAVEGTKFAKQARIELGVGCIGLKHLANGHATCRLFG